MKCMRNGCNNTATKRAEMVIYADKDHAPAVGSMELYGCDNHSTEQDAKDIIAEGPGREQIETLFMGLGYKKPDWNLSFVRWISCD